MENYRGVFLDKGSAFPDTPADQREHYGAGDMNGIRKSFMTAGVKSGCAPSLSEGKVKIGEGICFFDSGAVLKIPAEGIFSEVLAGADSYISLTHDFTANTIGAVCTSEPPSGGAVPICQVKADGTLIDRRIWCLSKLPMAAARAAGEWKQYSFSLWAEDLTAVKGRWMEAGRSIEIGERPVLGVVFRRDSVIGVYSCLENRYTYTNKTEGFNPGTKWYQDSYLLTTESKVQFKLLTDGGRLRIQYRANETVEYTEGLYFSYHFLVI